MKKRAATSPGTPVGIPPAAVSEEFDNDVTPAPQSVEEIFGWHHIGERIDKLELGFSAFQQSFPRLEGMFNEYALPMLKSTVARIDELLQRQERNSARLELFFDKEWPGLCEAVDHIGERLARVERKQDEFVSALALHNERIARAEKRLDEIDRQLDVINGERRDARTIVAERRRWLSWGKASYAVATIVIGAAAYLAGIHL